MCYATSQRRVSVRACRGHVLKPGRPRGSRILPSGRWGKIPRSKSSVVLRQPLPAHGHLQPPRVPSAFSRPPGAFLLLPSPREPLSTAGARCALMVNGKSALALLPSPPVSRSPAFQSREASKQRSDPLMGNPLPEGSPKPPVGHEQGPGPAHTRAHQRRSPAVQEPVCKPARR